MGTSVFAAQEVTFDVLCSRIIDVRVKCSCKFVRVNLFVFQCIC